MLEVGSLVDGKYRILQKIGQGGMSVVYLARNERANKTWAIKEVRKDGVHDFEVVKQGLVAEIDMLKKLNHPHLPSIIDVIDGRDSFLIVMDYIEGNPLDKALAATGAQSQENVINWAKQLCDVLGYLHSRKPPIVYRDMKPSNVMLKSDGNVVLIDSGTAREYKSQNVADTTCLGTRGYAAPEQFGGMGQTDARTDIYCLGATIYHLVTGHNPCMPPYEIRPIREWNPMLSEGLEQIIIKCTQNNPADRYQSCAELYYDLEHFEELDYKTRRKNNTKWRMFIASCILTVVMFAGAIGTYVAKNSISGSTYDSYMAKGNEGSTFDEKYNNYKEAINIQPSKVEPYLEILKVLTDDRISEEYFTDDEYSKFRSEVLEHSNTGYSNKTNISILQEENKQGYAQLAMELGYSCYFECDDIETSNAASRAKTWYDNAVNTNELSEKDESRAKMISTMVEKRDGVTRLKKDGTREITYMEYWGSIIEILNQSAQDTPLMQLQMCRYALNEIKNHAKDFIKEKIDAQAIREKNIDYAKELCSKLLNSGELSKNETCESVYKEIMVSQNGGKSLVERAEDSLANAILQNEKANQNQSAKQEGV